MEASPINFDTIPGQSRDVTREDSSSRSTYRRSNGRSRYMICSPSVQTAETGLHFKTPRNTSSANVFRSNKTKGLHKYELCVNLSKEHLFIYAAHLFSDLFCLFMLETGIPAARPPNFLLAGMYSLIQPAPFQAFLPNQTTSSAALEASPNLRETNKWVPFLIVPCFGGVGGNQKEDRSHFGGLQKTRRTQMAMGQKPVP